MEKSIAICVVTNNSYWESRYCIENLLAKTKLRFRLYVVDNGSKDTRIKDYCRKLCIDHKGYFKELPEVVSLSVAWNHAMKIVGEDKCVLFPLNCLVNHNWLEDLYYYHEVIQNVGCIGIRNGFEKLHFMPLVHSNINSQEDPLENVFISSNNSIEGVMMFDPKILLETGYLDTQLHFTGCEFLEWVFRVSALGVQNIYIRNQTLIHLHLRNEILFPKKSKDAIEELRINIEAMVKKQMFKK